MKVVMGSLAQGNVRLLKYHREQIARKVLNYKFQNSTNQLQSLETEHRNLAQAVYEATFSKKERELMDSLPQGWMFEDADIKAKFGGEVVSLYFSGYLGGLRGSAYNELGQMGYKRPDDVQRRMPYHNHYGIQKVFAHDDPLTVRFNSLSRRFQTMIEEARKSSRMLNATLAASYTSNALIKAWPEVAPFVKQVCGSPSAPSTALVVPVTQLNETFGLPVPESAESSK
jgi:hypothetical protein